MKCMQCVIWFFVISVCVAESILSFRQGGLYFLSEWTYDLSRYAHFACVLLLAAMHIPIFGRRARAGVCATVGIALMVLGNWFAGSLIILYGAITYCTRGDEAGEVEEFDDETSESPSSAFPVVFRKASTPIASPFKSSADLDQAREVDTAELELIGHPARA